MGRLLNARKATLFGSHLILLAVGVLPVLLMLWSSFRQNGSFTLAHYAVVFGSARTWALFANSILLAFASTVLAGFFGIALGVLIGKIDLPLRKVIAVVFCLPLLFPPYVLAIGWFEFLGRGGLVTRWFGATSGELTSRLLFGLPGAAFVMGSAFLPIVLLLTIAALQNVEPSLEEAARLTSGWPTTLKHITVPLIRPGISLSLLLVFLLSMGELGVPGFLRVNVLPVASFSQLSAFYDFGAATAATVPFVLIVLIAVSIAARSSQEERYVFRWMSRETSRIPLGRRSPAILAAVMMMAVVVVGMPIGGVLLRGLSIAALTDAVGRAGGSAFRTFLYAGAASLFICLLTFFVAYGVHRRAMPGWRFAQPIALGLFALPGAIIGIGLIALWNRPAFNAIYSSPAMLIMGLVAQYAAIGTGLMMAGLSQLPPSLEEAAEICGAGWSQRMFRILFPLLQPSMLAAAAITFIFSVRDLSLPLLLAPPGGDTLTARTMTLMANGSPDLIAALCVLSIAVAVIPLGTLSLAWKARSRQE